MFKFLPVYQAHVDSSDTALPINEEGSGQSVNATVKLCDLVVAKQNAVIYFYAFDEWLDYIPPVVVHGDSQNHQPALLVLALKILEPWDFNFARTAPGGPKIQQNDLAAVIGEMDNLSIAVFQGEIRGVMAVLIDFDRCSIARKPRPRMIKEVAESANHYEPGYDRKHNAQFRHGRLPLLLII
jgi:hypothetical protein